jgi:hypothetical protein
MLGFGPLGGAPLGAVPDFDTAALAATSDILQSVVTSFVNERLLSAPPSRLHHYTSLATAQKILEGDDIRLSHAEYSNDQMEMAQAKEVISRILTLQAGNSNFLAEVFTQYANIAPNLDAYIFCMSEGDDQVALPQDRLSQWRAYGQDGRGICISLNSVRLSHLSYFTPGLRINPVIYPANLQNRFIEAILREGVQMNGGGNPNPTAVAATVGALAFATPLMKADGFREEREWRLIFMPPANGPQPALKFHPRRDFLAPFVELRYIWNTLRPELNAITAIRRTPPINVLEPTGAPLLPIEEVMVGPSGHQPLNIRAMTKLLNQTPWPLIPTQSAIPYRAVG